MAKRRPPPTARPKGTMAALADAPNSSPKHTVSSAAKPPNTSATKSATQDAGGGLQAIFGENVRAARLHYGLRQSELAERTGLAQQYLSLIESGQQNVTLKTVELLAEVLCQDPSAMLRRPAGVPEKK
jgi:ribosome-binding protein aMBF1 (putative translation factor)